MKKYIQKQDLPRSGKMNVPDHVQECIVSLFHSIGYKQYASANEKHETKYLIWEDMQFTFTQEENFDYATGYHYCRFSNFFDEEPVKETQGYVTEELSKLESLSIEASNTQELDRMLNNFLKNNPKIKPLFTNQSLNGFKIVYTIIYEK